MDSYRNILLIEDDPAVARSLINGLEQANYHVDWKENGRDGIAFTRDHHPHLIILDLRLPDETGFDVCREMRRLNLRQPILMLTARREEADVDPAQKQRVARAEEQALRLQDLAENLLELSQLEAGMAAGSLSPTDLTTLVQSTGELYASRAEQVGLDFEMQLPERPLAVQADEKQLRRAVANLLDNSLKFTAPPGEVALSLVREEDSAVFTVRGTGIGIPDEDVAQLFNRFHRGRNASGYAGSGLGLAIVQEIMKGHQGQVSVSSGEWGTEVKLTLPHSVEDIMGGKLGD